MRISGHPRDSKKPKIVNYNRINTSPNLVIETKPPVESPVLPVVPEVVEPPKLKKVRPNPVVDLSSTVRPSPPVIRPKLRQKHIDSKDTDYQLKFALVDSRAVINLCGPEYNYKPEDWEDSKELQKRTQVGQRYIHLMNKAIGFYDKLEKSILTEGFRNPILLTAGYPRFRSMDEVPPFLRGKPFEMLVCEIMGGSRLLIAQKHGFLIPAIINDFVGMFQDSKTLNGPTDIAGCFSDVPSEIIITNRGLRISPPKHIHLENGYQDPEAVMATRRHVLRGTIND